MKTDIWMPIYIKDYLASTSRLKTEEHGIYLLLLFDYWINGSIPNDEEIILQITKQPKENLQVINGLLDRFFYLDGQTYKNDRIEKELLSAQNRREVAKKNGLKGGRPPKEKKPIGYSRVNPNHNPQKTSSQSPIPLQSQSTTKTPTENIKETKKKYGEHQNVLLTDDENLKLQTKLGLKFYDLVIDKLSQFKESSGKKYKSDYAAINTWTIDSVKQQSHKDKNLSKKNVLEENEDVYEKIIRERGLGSNVNNVQEIKLTVSEEKF